MVGKALAIQSLEDLAATINREHGLAYGAALQALNTPSLAAPR